MTQLETCENKFKEWLDKKNYGYLHISQDPTTFSDFFRHFSKRPDFLIAIPSISIIAVDVKYWGRYDNFLFDEKEVKNFNAFERHLRIPVWYSIATSKHFATWYWISNSEILEKGDLKKSSKSGDYFFVVDPKILKQVAYNDSIARIFM